MKILIMNIMEKTIDLNEVRDDHENHYESTKIIPKPGKSKANERGILVSYTWEDEAKILGSMSCPERLRVITDQIYKMHKDDIPDDVFSEVGDSQAWYNDEETQGAFCLNLPDNYNEFLSNFKPHKVGNNRIMFGGEAISWSTGWIQGALESALRNLIFVMEYLTHTEE